MPAAFVISGRVRSRDGDDPAGLRVVVEHRRLPTRERQQPAAPVLAEEVTDAEGRFRLGFEAPDGPDLSFGVLDRGGRPLVVAVAVGPNAADVEEILFNAVSPLEVTLTVARRDRAVAESEYEALLRLAGPDLADVAPGDLAEDDLDFLARDLGPEAGDNGAGGGPELRQRLAYLRAADLLSRTTRLVGGAFYGWARLGLPDLWTQLPAFDEAERRDDFLARLLDLLAGSPAVTLADGLRRAVDAGIIPRHLADRADTLSHAVRRRALTPVSVRLRLTAGPGAQPLPACTVETFDGARALGADLTDAAGALTVRYDADPSAPDAARTLRLRISGAALSDPVEVTLDVVPPEAEVPVPWPTPPDLQALASAGHLGVSPATLASLAASGITGYGDLRRRGGAAGLVDVEPEDVARLDALTELDLLTPDPAEAAALLERGYPSLSALAEAPWGRFLDRVVDDEGLSLERAAELRTSAAAQVGLLDLLLAGYGADLADGYAS